MIFTTVRVERPEGTVLLSGVAVQIESASGDGERLDFADARPFDLFWLYTTQGVPLMPLQRRDVLIDEINSDPETGQPARYRIVGAVETFENDHQEALCERVVGG
ncbi:MAG TPA: hypothetical protein VFU63_14540 [Ktedonobacterales bacterium]|nr:hypothetical protein [Ktedonobacterales bacterium]